MKIRPFSDHDWPDVWGIIEPVFQKGDTYAFDRDISESDAYHAWVEKPAAVFVALLDSQIVGTYYIKPNQPAQGAHVCNCGYIVDPSARGRGLATAMCQHSQREAVSLGFRAMQYNLVVSTNDGAVRLWQKLGFDIIGTLPQAFHHPVHGYVDAHVMYRLLEAN